MTQRTKITASQVAKLAGVSQPTVSRVFTPGSKVSVEKAERVKTAARELGYLPNTLARSLNSGRSYTIGILIPYLKNQFYANTLQMLAEKLSEQGYHVMVFFAVNIEKEVDSFVDRLLAHQVDGFILASVSISNLLTKRLQKLNIPFVLFNRGQEHRELPSITAANYEGGRKAGRFLAAGGHKRIVHIGGWQGSLNGRERQAGFMQGLKEFGLEPFAIRDCRYHRSMARAAVLELFSAPDVPDAVFCGNDHMAFGVLETLKFELELSIPSDVSIIGYDDVAMSSWKMIDLTTLRQPIRRMTNVCVEMLLDMIDDPKKQHGHVEIESDLIVRGSARVPDAWPI